MSLILCTYSPLLALAPGIELFRRDSQVASPEFVSLRVAIREVGEVPKVPPVLVGDILEADRQAPLPIGGLE